MCEQPPYSILVRGIEADVLPTCERYGMGVIPWSPLAGGWLSGKWRDGADDLTSRRAPAASPTASTSSQPENQRKLDAADALAVLAEEAGHLASSTWRWRSCSTTRRSPRRSSGRARWSSSRASSARPTCALDDDVLDRIDEIVPPGHELQLGRRRLRPADGRRAPGPPPPGPLSHHQPSLNPTCSVGIWGP